MNPIGGTTLSAAIADSQLQLNAAIGADWGAADSMQGYADAYRASNGGPTLAFLGFNPFQILANGALRELYWAAVVVILGITTVVAMQQALASRQTMRSRHPLATIAQIYFRLLAGVLIVANTPLVYAALMTVNSAFSEGIVSMSGPSLSQLLQAGGAGALSLAQVRFDAIRRAAARRVIALYPSNASRDEMVQIGNWYDATAAALNSALAARGMPGELPRLNSPGWSDPQQPDDRVASYVGRTVVQNFGQLVADLGALPADGGALSIAFPSGGSTALPPLSSALAADDAQAGQAVALPNTPSSGAAFEAARQLYASNVLADTLHYLDTDLLSVVGASPNLADRVKAWFSEKVDQAAAAAGGLLIDWRAVADWAARGIGIVLTRMVAFVLAAGSKALIEMELFVLVLAVPLWLLPQTESAFYGVLHSLASLSVALPAYQLVMLLVDALMSLVLKYLLLGPIVGAKAGAAATGASAAYVATSALAAAASGGEIIALATFCYLIAYFFLAIYAAIKTPRIVTLFLRGAGAAGGFLSMFGTGLVTGAATALATATAAGGPTVGSLAGRIFAGGAAGRASAGTSGSGMPAPIPARSETPVSRSSPPVMGRVVARPGRASAFGVARFGIGTFIDGLRASSPADGIKIAAQALERRRKEEKKEAPATRRRSAT